MNLFAFATSVIAEKSLMSDDKQTDHLYCHYVIPNWTRLEIFGHTFHS